MTLPTLKISSAAPLSLAADVLVLGVRATDDGPRLVTEDAEFAELSASLDGIGVTGGVDELVRVPAAIGSARSIALVGLGTSTPGQDSLRYAAGTASRRLTGVTSLVIALPTLSSAEVLAVLEGAAIGAYSYTSYRSSTLEKTKLPATDITIATEIPADDELVSRASIVAGAIHSVRDLVNAPPSDLYPESFADAVLELAEDLPVEVEVLAEDELLAGDFGGILGVGQGSTRGPRLVKISYSPTTARSHLALVGKGITFDTGGLSLKPPAGMVGMKYDMAGAATVMAAVFAAARLGLDIRLTAWLCLAENMPSGSAIRPNDVLRMKGGTTVEVLNTDAEGRLVMADGLVAASEEFPDAIIDVATLTGAQRVALGDRYSGVMGDDALVGRVAATARTVGEQLWPMPLPGELRALLKSDVADIANAKIGNTAAGMLLAGVFLQEFVGSQSDSSAGRIPWAHIDIAGPAHNAGGGYGYIGTGPSGVAVRTLIALAEEISLA
ncbi:leucyl aminopeptidase [Glaciihabitans sp. INWT7]|uniref:leucyl aminopeptidase n=1 Tax=Glaciihabitans sp. INWT7 TaxID=2596912 RepID=UPI001626DCD7|nr:leucyl aminopeptidase [Glaciihabitans sp. INWT7]QNE46953.1 leucyl aminopeptidase [Glaciihabitans sp. INWT7]